MRDESWRGLLPSAIALAVLIGGGCTGGDKNTGLPLPDSPEAAVRRFVQAMDAGDVADLRRVTAADEKTLELIEGISQALAADRRLLEALRTEHGSEVTFPQSARFTAVAIVGALGGPPLVMLSPEHLDKVTCSEQGETRLVAISGMILGTAMSAEGGWRVAPSPPKAEPMPGKWQQVSVQALRVTTAALSEMADRVAREHLSVEQAQAVLRASDDSPEMKRFNEALVRAAASKSLELP